MITQLLTFIIISQAPISIAEPGEHQIPEFAKMLAQAALNKNWLVVAGIALMFVVLIFKKIILPRLAQEERYKPFIPLVTFAISIILGVATWILNPTMNPVDIMGAVFGAATIASGSWETMLKPFIKVFVNIKMKAQDTIEKPKS